jgi:hypothetical protein
MKRLLLVLLAVCYSLTAADVSIRWRDLGNLVKGNQVSIVADGGKRIKGTALSVEGDSLLIESKDGKKLISRSSIQQLRMAKHSSYKWRAIGTAIGAGIGIGAAIPILTETHNEGSGAYDGGAAGLIAGLAGAGFLLGWSTDRNGQVIRIVD